MSFWIYAMGTMQYISFTAYNNENLECVSVDSIYLGEYLTGFSYLLI